MGRHRNARGRQGPIERPPRPSGLAVAGPFSARSGIKSATPRAEKTKRAASTDCPSGARPSGAAVRRRAERAPIVRAERGRASARQEEMAVAELVPVVAGDEGGGVGPLQRAA